MKLVKRLKLVVGLTVLALTYIHLQMQIMALAYQGEAQKRQVMVLREENDYVTYNVLRLKSADHLGGKVLSEDSDLDFVDPGNIIHLTASEKFFEEGHAGEAPASEKKTHFLSGLLSLGAEAQARP